MRSMTGFGSAVADVGGRRYHVQLRTVNHRFFEAKFRVARELQAVESECAARIRARIERGHVEIQIQAADAGEAQPPATMRVDAATAAQLLAQARRLGETLGLADNITLPQVLGWPGVIVAEGERELGAHAPAVLAALDEALAALFSMRESEGARLAADLQERLEALDGAVTRIGARAPVWAGERRARLRQRLADVTTARLDPGALEHEVATAVERADISEELVRLRSHLGAMQTELQNPAGRGKKLEFLSQELLREFNTIGSKSQDTQITQAVVEAKCEIERIREQVNNLE